MKLVIDLDASFESRVFQYKALIAHLPTDEKILVAGLALASVSRDGEVDSFVSSWCVTACGLVNGAMMQVQDDPGIVKESGDNGTGVDLEPPPPEDKNGA